jgi:ribose-phosphate pyrophosphokinase
VPLSDEMLAISKVTQLTMSGVLAEAIRRVSNEESISAMFSH